MGPMTEFEVKLELCHADLERLCACAFFSRLGDPKLTQNQKTVYFDTPDHSLARHHMSLRIRHSGRHLVQTAKALRDSPLERSEWETPLHNNSLDLEFLDRTALAAVLTQRQRRMVQPVFSLQVERRLYPIRLDGAELELTIDEGILRAGPRSRPICEVEIELKYGGKGPVFQLARQIIHETSAILSLRSKSAQGYALAGEARRSKGSPSADATGLPVRLLATTPVVSAIRTLGYACLGQILDHQPGVVAHLSQAVHQMRVAIRRLRTFMWFFRAPLAGPQAFHIRQELKWLMTELEAARECHVLRQRIAAHEPYPAEAEPWVQALETAGEQAHVRAARAVQCERFRLLGLDIARWLELGDWTHAAQNGLQEQLIIPVSAQFAHIWAKIRRRGRHIGRLDPAKRHRLRILVKKMRYGLEFFRSVYTGRAVQGHIADLLKPLEKLQDALGELNDLRNAQSMLRTAGLSDGAMSTENDLYALLKSDDHVDSQVLIKRAKKAYVRLMDMPVVW